MLVRKKPSIEQVKEYLNTMNNSCGTQSAINHFQKQYNEEFLVDLQNAVNEATTEAELQELLSLCIDIKEIKIITSKMISLVAKMIIEVQPMTNLKS